MNCPACDGRADVDGDRVRCSRSSCGYRGRVDVARAITLAKAAGIDVTETLAQSREFTNMIKGIA